MLLTPRQVGSSGKFFSVLGQNNINIEMISQGASEINISCVIESREADRALNGELSLSKTVKTE